MSPLLLSVDLHSSLLTGLYRLDNSLYETWEQLRVAILDTDSAYDHSRIDHRLGGFREDGMLTSPSVTYLKLSLWSQRPVTAQASRLTVLFRVRVADQFEGREPPIPRNLVEKVQLSLLLVLLSLPELITQMWVQWNRHLKRIELVPPPPTPPPSSPVSLIFCSSDCEVRAP